MIKMFTGIVKARGVLCEVQPLGTDSRLNIEVPESLAGALREGDSMCVNGVCLTMTDPGSKGFAADVSAETLARTTLGSLQQGDVLNLEPAMTLADPLGGHLVSGHVDGVAELVARESDGRAQRFEFRLPDGLERYVAQKGSVCVDGVSLTVNSVAGNVFTVCLIPHTLDVTTLGRLVPGDGVNVEVDLIARYLERLSLFENRA